MVVCFLSTKLPRSQHGGVLPKHEATKKPAWHDSTQRRNLLCAAIVCYDAHPCATMSTPNDTALCYDASTCATTRHVLPSAALSLCYVCATSVLRYGVARSRKGIKAGRLGWFWTFGSEQYIVTNIQSIPAISIVVRKETTIHHTTSTVASRDILLSCGFRNSTVPESPFVQKSARIIKPRILVKSISGSLHIT